MAIISKWWDGHAHALQHQRERLAAAALSAPDDVELQAEIAEEVERMLGGYKSLLLPVIVSFGVGFGCEGGGVRGPLVRVSFALKCQTCGLVSSDHHHLITSAVSAGLDEHGAAGAGPDGRVLRAGLVSRVWCSVRSILCDAGGTLVNADRNQLNS
jgi:hypothetical protein